MRIAFLLALSILMTVNLSHAQKGDDSLKVQKQIIAFFDGLSSLSSEQIQRTVTSDFILLEDGEVWNMDSLTRAMAPMKQVRFTRKNTFAFYQTTIKDNVAWINYDNKADITVNDKPFQIRWLESAVLVKQEGAWKIAQLHSTKITK